MTNRDKWMVLFEKVTGRKPTADEFMAGKATGFDFKQIRNIAHLPVEGRTEVSVSPSTSPTQASTRARKPRMSRKTMMRLFLGLGVLCLLGAGGFYVYDKMAGDLGNLKVPKFFNKEADEAGVEEVVPAETEQVESKQASDSRFDLEQLQAGDYSSLAGYWEAVADPTNILVMRSTGPVKAFAGMTIGDSQQVEDIHETTYSRTRASDDNHLTDTISYTKSLRSFDYKYVPKGMTYAASYGADQADFKTAAEDLILYHMNGETVYTAYRFSPYGEIKKLATTYLTNTEFIFSGLLESELLLGDDTINLYRFDAGEFLDVANASVEETYDLNDLLEVIGTNERRSGKASDLTKSDLESLLEKAESGDLIYFEGDGNLLYFLGNVASSEAFPHIAPEEEWEIREDQVTVPILDAEDKPYGQMIFKVNNKTYEGGRQRFAYYLYKIEQK